MKKSLTLNLKDVKSYTTEWFEQLTKNRRKLILTVLSVFGIWCGTKLYISCTDNISEILSNVLQIFSNRLILKTFIVLIIINLMPVIISFLNGFFVFGMPFLMLSPCLSGVLIGIVNAWIFSVYKLNGVFFSLLSVIPFAVAVMIMLLVSNNESIALSVQLSKAVFLNETGDRGEVKDYFIRHTIIIAVIVAVTLLQSTVIINLSGRLLV